MLSQRINRVPCACTRATRRNGCTITSQYAIFGLRVATPLQAIENNDRFFFFFCVTLKRAVRIPRRNDNARPRKNKNDQMPS